MSIAFQILVIFMIGLIAYWWANQGLFSAILHFVAVVCAGAIAFAVWEPIVVGLVLSNKWYDSYAWGLTLVVVFGGSLAGLRILFDRLAPANVQIPHWANLAFGGLFGVGSGVLTVGILMIAMGFTQSADKFMNLKLTARERNTIGNSPEGDPQSLWVPAHTWTARFYEMMSAGAFRPDFEGVAMRQANPDLDEQAFSLMRDTYNNGSARITIPPNAVTDVSASMNDSRVFVRFTVSNAAFDHAQQFVMSSSQARLLCYENGNVTSGEVAVAFPDRWVQHVSESVPGGASQRSEKTFIFDDKGHYATSVPGQQTATFQLQYPIGGGDYRVPLGFEPRYLQIKGVRFPIESLERVAGGGGGLGPIARTTVPTDPNAPLDNNEAIQSVNHIRPLSISINALGSLEHDGNRYLTEGRGTFQRGRRSGNRDTRVQGIFATEGTAIVRVDVSRQSLANIYGPVRETVGEDAAPALTDSSGNVYYAKGYMIHRDTATEINLTPSTLIKRVGDLPHLPTSGQHEMILFFEVTEGVQLESFRLGDATVCRTNIRATSF